MANELFPILFANAIVPTYIFRHTDTDVVTRENNPHPTCFTRRQYSLYRNTELARRATQCIEETGTRYLYRTTAVLQVGFASTM